MCRSSVLFALLFAFLPAILHAANPPPAAAPASADDAYGGDITWGYKAGEDGPAEWAQLNRKLWGTCSSSTMQSPLQIVDMKETCDGKCVQSIGTWNGDPPNVFSNGDEKRFSMNGLKPIIEGQVQNNGHSLVVSVPPNHAPMYTVFEGRKYKCLQYHFHALSEHQVNGYQAPLEMHIVHEGANGGFLVVGVFFEEADQANLFLNGIGFRQGGVPVTAGTRMSLSRAVNPLGAVDDMSVYNDAATEQMRNSQVLSLKLQLTGWALSPRTVAAQKEFKEAWDLVADNDEARARSLREAYIFNNPAPNGGKDAMDRPPLALTELYHEIHLKHHPYYRDMLYSNNYYDIFVFDTIGNLIYSVYKELDYATNFQTTGRYGGSGLGKAFRAAMANPTSVNEIPWEPYEPSYGALASFVSTGIQENGVTIGVFCIQLPPDAIQEAIEMGTYVAGRRRLLAAAAPAAAAEGASNAANWVRSANDESCALRLNQMRIGAGCHTSAVAGTVEHRRRAGSGGDDASAKCPNCPSLREEGTMDLDYWTYDGSLTTPPCTEGVKWVVLKKRTPATSLQIQAFPFRGNFRPPQPIFARRIMSGSAPAWQWGYGAANGPHAWAANGYSFCGGAHQSPINIETAKTREYTHFDFIPQYEPQHNLYIINTGKSVEVQLRLTKDHISEENGVKAAFESQTYFLTKISFHKESEHMVNGKKGAMEAQFNHRQEGNKDVAPHLVVSVIYQLSAECDTQLDVLNWENLPQNVDNIGMHVPDSFLVEDLMPMSRRYWTYDGTLTVPPCTPGVQWVILSEYRNICQRQLDAFPVKNTRPIQPIDDRYVQVGSFRATDGVSDDFWHWDYYHQYRPATWGRYYAQCLGTSQSPINIMTKNLKDHGNAAENQRLHKHWHSICGVRTRNNGHTVVVDMPAGYTVFEDVSWRVKAFHFHAPSETQIDGAMFPLEMHIVHADMDGLGRNLVMSVLFQQGTANSFLRQIDWHMLPALPHSKSEEETHEISKAVDLNMMIDNKNSGMEYYSYMGSLTTPPCTEGVQWVVMTNPDHVDKNQLLHFYNVLHHSNFRTPQPLNGRIVTRNSPPHEINEKDLWGYDELNGPNTWGAAGFPECLESHQSPIDIETASRVENPYYAINWREWQGTTGGGRLYMENDHNRMYILKGFGSKSNKITFEGQFYYLDSLMFHKRSETRINGQQFDFEVHFVHKNEVGMYLYLVQLYNANAGDNAGLQKLNWNELNGLMITPQESARGVMTKTMKVNTNFSPMELIDLMGLDKTDYPNGPLYYHYDGSMSTPPCTEGVTWIVMEQPSIMSKTQLAQYPLDNSVRPVMPLNGRVLHYMSSIDPEAMYAASKMRHDNGEVMHSAKHGMTTDVGVSGVALVRGSQVLALKLQLMKWGKAPRAAEALKEFKGAWDAYGENDAERGDLLREAYIFDNPYPFGSKDSMDRPPATLTQGYHDIHLKHHPYYRQMLYDNNYYDIFVLDTKGNLVYSVYKELDYGTNFQINGRYGNSGLGKAFRAAMANPDVVNEIPWEPYEPSYGALASFVATGIMDDVTNIPIGVFCIQLPPEARATVGGRRRAAPAAPSNAGGFHWGYGIENGPQKWPLHEPQCIGYTQSPIVIEECLLSRRSKNKMFPNWKFTQDLAIENNGYTLVVNGLKDSYTEFEGVRYDAVQFHFHAASEHLLHGEQYPFEMHIVHTRRDPVDNLDKPALVIGIIFDIGAENVDLSSLFFGDKDMPKIQGHKQLLKFPFNPVHFMPYNKNYYTYDGSLTTPPCTEGLRWVVMQSNMYLSAQQLATFPFKNNFRNPQPMLGRPVYFLSQQDQYLYQTVAGTASALHFAWSLVIGTFVALAVLY